MQTNMPEVVASSDWLGSDPIYYSPSHGDWSRNVNSLLSPSQRQFHLEGLTNFVRFGYSVFGQTPIQEIQVLEYASDLITAADGGLQIRSRPDPALEHLDRGLSESDVIELVRSRVREWETSHSDVIIVPLSGGFDSRLILWAIEDKSRVRAFSYGLSPSQSDSWEVTYAQEVARRLGVRWEHIRLGEYHRFIPDWLARYGVATHAHGMYQMEFYQAVQARLGSARARVLSGIFGDVWAGSTGFRRLHQPTDLLWLGYRHGMHGDDRQLIARSEAPSMEEFWARNKELINDPRTQPLMTIRLKMILISYLLSVPELYGFDAWSPFLDAEVAMAMSSLPSVRREHRRWQRDFFTRVGLDLEGERVRGSRRMALNSYALAVQPVAPLDVRLLESLFEPTYVAWINRKARWTRRGDMVRFLLSVPKLRGALRLSGLEDSSWRAYCAYLTLLPIERELALAQAG